MSGAYPAELPLAPVVSQKLFCAVELTGQPIGKGRPRFTRSKSGRPLVYTPAETRAYERDLAWAAKLSMGAREPTRLPVAIDVSAYLEIPSSWSRAKRESALAGTLLPSSVMKSRRLMCCPQPRTTPYHTVVGGAELCITANFRGQCRSDRSQIYCALIPAAFMVGHHLSISDFCKAPSASGVCCSIDGSSSASSVNRLRTA